MRYHLKKAIFFCLSILSIGGLLYLIGCYLYDTSAYRLLEGVLGIGDYFTTDQNLFFVLFSYVSTCALALVSLLFYRKEVALWPKLLLLASGSIVPQIYARVHDYYFGVSVSAARSPWNWEATVFNSIFFLFTLAAMIGLILAMVKYPKAVKKIASTDSA